MATELEAIAAELRDIGQALPDLELLVLFGSRATGRATRRSDVDVAVRARDVADLDALYVALAPRFRTDRLDLVDLRRAGPTLSFQIARQGVLLYERCPGSFREFQSLASRRYCDTAKLRRAQQRAIAVFLERERRP
jgi:predicted nucleotidyltransferase